MIIPKCSIACFMALMCGLRIREACRLEILDIDLERKYRIKDNSKIQKINDPIFIIYNYLKKINVDKKIIDIFLKKTKEDIEDKFLKLKKTITIKN